MPTAGSAASSGANAAALEFANLIDGLLVENTEAAKTAQRENIKENSTRYAVCEVSYSSFGVGQMRVKPKIMFGVGFKDEPQFTTGSAVVTHPDPDNWHDPVGLAGVRSWERNGNGLYVGAHIWLRTEIQAITYATTQPDTHLHTLHYLTFAGEATKIITKAKTASMKTRTVGVQ